MKKLNYFFALLFLFTAFISCDKRNLEARLEAISEYTGTAIPIVNVGNTSCEDLDGEYLFSSGRINFNDGTFDFSDANTSDWPEGVDPVTGWPNGLSVTVSDDGRYVSFTYESANYCIGAVIVKGGNASNIYTYDPPTKSDENLSSPVNASDMPAGLSNLTFCFVECPPEPEIMYLAVKAWYWESFNFETSSGTGRTFTLSTALSTGVYPFINDSWCNQFGANPLESSTIPLLNGVGSITIEKGTVAWTITVDLNEGMALDHTYLFIGSLSELIADANSNWGCPLYSNWVYQNETDQNTHIYTVPF